MLACLFYLNTDAAGPWTPSMNTTSSLLVWKGSPLGCPFLCLFISPRTDKHGRASMARRSEALACLSCLKRIPTRPGPGWRAKKKPPFGGSFSYNENLFRGQSFVASIPQTATITATVMANSIIVVSSTVLSLTRQSYQQQYHDHI